MRIIPPERALAGPAGDPAHFTGPVSQLPLHPDQNDATVRVYVVHFRDGASTHWHEHGGGQVLHVIEGAGEVQAWGGDVVSMGPGDSITAEPGERHWHGAARGSDMAHLAVSLGDVNWLEAPDRG